MRKQTVKTRTIQFGHRLLILAMITCILTITWLLPWNLIVRMPDLYLYEFNRVELSDQLELPLSNVELADAVSNQLMQGVALSSPQRTDHGNEKLMLLLEELDALLHLKQRADQSLQILVIAAASFSLIFLILFLLDRETLLRIGFYHAGFAMAGLTLLFLLPFLLQDLSMLQPVIQNYAFGSSLYPESTLAEIFSPSLAKKGLLLLIALSWVFYLILFQLTSSLTKPYLMFQKRYAEVRFGVSVRR